MWTEFWEDLSTFQVSFGTTVDSRFALASGHWNFNDQIRLQGYNMIQVLMDKIRLAGWVTSIAVIHGKFIRMLPYSQLQMKIYRDPRIQKSGKPPGGRVFNGWRSTLRHFTTSTGAGARCKDLLQHGESRCQRALTAVPTPLVGSWFNRRTLVVAVAILRKMQKLQEECISCPTNPHRTQQALAQAACTHMSTWPSLKIELKCLHLQVICYFTKGTTKILSRAPFQSPIPGIKAQKSPS